MRWLLAVLGAVIGLGGLEILRRRQEFWTGPHYREQIAVLRPTRRQKLDLPPIKTLQGVVADATADVRLGASGPPPEDARAAVRRPSRRRKDNVERFPRTGTR